MRRNGSPGQRGSVRTVLTGLCLLAGIAFVWHGVDAYRERKALEAEIAARSQDIDQMIHMDSSGDEASPEAGNQEEESNPTAESLLARADSGDFPDFGEATIAWQGRTWRRSRNVKAILCMGVDRSDEMTEYRSLTVEGNAGQADGIFLLAWDSARGQVRLLMIPRDTMTEITALNDDGSLRGREVDHLTLAYAYGDGREMSCENVTESVSHLLLNLPVDSYLAVDIQVIGTLNDAVGGVTVTVPTAGMEQADPSFIQGEIITLHGSQAERFVRYRDIHTANSALTRMSQHRQFIQGFFDAVREQAREDSGTVAALFEQIQDYMVTDMRKEEYLKTAMDVLMGEGIPQDGYYTLPGMGLTTDHYDEYYVDTEKMVPVLLELFFYSTEE
ncbi:MAG: LCP family protein [Clostridiales bacterium]|nr:LCP family protein [Clostridiales bacterium]